MTGITTVVIEGGETRIVADEVTDLARAAAQDAAVTAALYANNAFDTPIPGAPSGERSALHWAQISSQYANAPRDTPIATQPPTDRSARHFAEVAQDVVQSIGPTAQAFLVDDGLTPDSVYVVDRAVLNGLSFLRFHARVTGGTGTVDLVVLVNGIIEHGPVTVTTAGRTDVIDISAAVDSDIEFGVLSVTGAPTVVMAKLVGSAA